MPKRSFRRFRKIYRAKQSAQRDHVKAPIIRVDVSSLSNGCQCGRLMRSTRGFSERILGLRSVVNSHDNQIGVARIGDADEVTGGLRYELKAGDFTLKSCPARRRPSQPPRSAARSMAALGWAARAC